MQNWILKVIPILGVAVAFSGLPPVVNVQLSQTAQAQSTPAIHNPTPPEPNSQLSNQPDLTLLAKTVANFLKSDRYRTESELELSAGASGLNFTSSVQINTIAQSPKQFRSEIGFGSRGSSQAKQYLVVSNGKQVWIYRPDINQYSVTDYQTFYKSYDSFFIGMSSSLFLEMAPDFSKLRTQGSASDTNIRDTLEEMLRSSKALIKGGKRNLEGRDYYVYVYTDPKEGYTINAFVAPETATVEQIQMNTTSEGIDAFLKEKILRRVANPAIAADTFSFSPPQGAIKVKSISLEPF